MQVRIKVKKPEQAPFPSLEDWAGRFLSLPLGELVSESVVERVHIAAKAVKAITRWMEKSLDTTPVPEVGGFLLGAWRKEENQQITLFIGEFVAAREMDVSNPSALVLGQAAMAELDKAMIAYPEWEVIGWLHTHPGHSPYLSEVDLPTHRAYFNRPQDIAIVIDPLTEVYDTGVFSQKPDGTMNNKTDYTQPLISWKALASESAAL